MGDSTAAGITGQRRVLLIGMCSAWLYFALSVGYAAAIVAAGAARGSPKDPYWGIAEVIVVVGALVLVILVAAIHYSAPLAARIFTLMALGLTLITVALTITVHFVELTVVRRIDAQSIPGFPRLFEFEWPSLLMAVEVLAWHLFFGLALLFAAFGFQGRGAEAVVHLGLMFSGALCLLGLLGPAFGNLYWRLPGVLGNGVLFPLVCLMIGHVFRQASSSLSNDQAGLSRAAVTTS